MAVDGGGLDSMRGVAARYFGIARPDVIVKGTTRSVARPTRMSNVEGCTR